MTDPLPTEEQRKQLGELMHNAFIELRRFNGEQAHDLAYAFHNLPMEIYGWGTWSIVGTRGRLLHYQKKHSQNLGVDYVALFDKIYAPSSRAAEHTMTDKIKMRDGDTMLIMVKDGAVVHFTPNMSLPHAEFVRRTTGQLPEGAWVGTVSRLEGEVVAISSKHFFGYQLPGPDWVQNAVQERFE
ncbi:MAG: hypothetical protein AB1813_19740 [Verrucomicrobiota bacterium]